MSSLLPVDTNSETVGNKEGGWSKVAPRFLCLNISRRFLCIFFGKCILSPPLLLSITKTEVIVVSKRDEKILTALE